MFLVLITAVPTTGFVIDMIRNIASFVKFSRVYYSP